MTMDYQKLMDMRNESNEFARHCGIYTSEIRAGYAEVRMESCQHILNPVGSVHGGCLYTLADVAAGSAAASHGRWPVTLSGNINYLKAGHRPTTLCAKAKEVKSGKNIAVYNVDILQDDEILLATSTFTMFLLDKTIEL